MTHEILLQDLMKWRETEEVVFASSTRERKTLKCTLNGVYKVYINNVLYRSTISAYMAMEAYNSIVDKFETK